MDDEFEGYNSLNEDGEKEFRCKLCGATHSHTIHYVSCETDVCCICRRKIIPRHIPYKQHKQFLELREIKK